MCAYSFFLVLVSGRGYRWRFEADAVEGLTRSYRVVERDCSISRACSDNSCSSAAYPTAVGARVIETQSELFGPSPRAFASSL